MCLPRHRDREENDDGGEGSRRSPPAKRPRSSCSFDDRQMELLEEMRRMLQGQNEKIEFMYRENQELREKVSFLTADISRLGGYLQKSPAPRFKLGVVAADERISERIQEGITESFAVKDIRGFSTKKSGNPTPRDAVYKLSRIAMNGDRHKLLEQNGIKTVGDLLRFYSRSPEDLRKIMGKISDQDWDKIINHAHKCNPRPGIYSSCIQERNVSHENEPFSRSNASLYLEGSCSVQLSPTIQKQLDVHVAHQQNLTTYNGISSGASSEKVSEELEGIQVADQQVSSVGNGILPVSSMDNNTLEGSSSQQQRSLELNVTPEGNGVLPRNQFPFDIDALLDLESFSGDDSWGNFDFGETCLGGSCNSVEHSGGLSSINGARNMSYGGLSAASEAGSVSYDVLSPFSEVASRSYRNFRPTPIRKAGGVSYESTDFRAEDEC